MVTSSVFVIANDVTPGLGLPVAAPGLRSFGMAEGLRNHGLDVTIIVPKHLLDRLWNQSTPPPMQPGIIALNGPDMAEFIESRAPRLSSRPTATRSLIFAVRPESDMSSTSLLPRCSNSRTNSERITLRTRFGLSAPESWRCSNSPMPSR